MPLPMERPSLDGLKALLVLSTPESTTVKLYDGARAFSRGVPPRKQTFGKLAYKELPSYKQDQARMAYNFSEHANVNVNLGKLTLAYLSILAT